MRGGLWWGVCVVAHAVRGGASGALPPFAATRLRVEYRDAPLNIDSPSPRFSWALSHPVRGEVQASAELSVFRAAGSLLWRTSVARGWTLNVPYEGPALEPDADYVWTVAYVDSTGALSVPASSTLPT